MRIKLKTGGSQAIVSLADDATLKDLFSEISGIPQVIKFGYPPRTLDTSDVSAKLSVLGIKNGEMLIVSLDTETKDVEPVAAPVKPSAKPVDASDDTPYITLGPSLFVLLRKIPDDNSCLFNSIVYLVFGASSVDDPFNAANLRSVVASTVIENSLGLYDKATLDGKSTHEYGSWIKQPTSWGGAIELQILGDYLGVSILTVDVETGNQYWFNESASNFIAVLYSGIHYDAITFQTQGEEVHTFVKNSDAGNQMIEGVSKLSSSLKQQGYFTNTSSFKIQCVVCGEKLKGDKDVSKHAKLTGHYEFDETK
ncbi:unnamed protein product [Kuraishia capsulata CBS 1993]|uniref:Ubiquitin thioesterase OTU n=1 Tax=Kuraishia capsulata CBS 1993 TaxID=1382522 RepID=W6MUB1_9ASCO|nr:uncharacterized protein KUCA_T00005064001 [Kuraishia capsulata CBS 1993]CDK29077.1 unnamed protein product [Kuraishia capsulata CBS 1993]